MSLWVLQIRGFLCDSVVKEANQDTAKESAFLPTVYRQVYTLGVGLLVVRPSPRQAGTGRTFIRIRFPLIHARPACERPIPAGGGVNWYGCIPKLYGHMGELHPRGGLPWILFLYVFFLSS
jgi:hypothetical protein